MLRTVRKGLAMALTGFSYLMAGVFIAGLIFTVVGTSQAMMGL